MNSDLQNGEREKKNNPRDKIPKEAKKKYEGKSVAIRIRMRWKRDKKTSE